MTGLKSITFTAADPIFFTDMFVNVIGTRNRQRVQDPAQLKMM